MQRKIRDDNIRRRVRRALKIRRAMSGTAERPRLAVYRSAKHIYAQLIDDVGGKTLVATSTLSKNVRTQVGNLKKADAAEKVGEDLAKLAKEKGIESCVFDRKGWPYHGRIAALAKAAREGGLAF
ncbi:MAG: 50S ribosomal protein L18 [Myxococcota bacterium]